MRPQTIDRLDFFVVTCPKDLAMYSAAAKTVGAEFEVIELTALLWSGRSIESRPWSRLLLLLAFASRQRPPDDLWLFALRRCPARSYGSRRAA